MTSVSTQLTATQCRVCHVNQWNGTAAAMLATRRNHQQQQQQQQSTVLHSSSWTTASGWFSSWCSPPPSHMMMMMTTRRSSCWWRAATARLAELVFSHSLYSDDVHRFTDRPPAMGNAATAKKGDPENGAYINIFINSTEDIRLTQSAADAAAVMLCVCFN